MTPIPDDDHEYAKQLCADAGFEDSTTPFVDAWMTLRRRDNDGLTAITLYNPSTLWVEDDGTTTRIRIGTATIVQPSRDARMMLRAMLEWVERAQNDRIGNPEHAADMRV